MDQKVAMTNENYSKHANDYSYEIKHFFDKEDGYNLWRNGIEM